MLTDEQIEKLLEARERLAMQAARLSTIFPAVELAKVFLSLGTTTMQKATGDDVAADFLKALAAEIRAGRSLQ